MALSGYIKVLNKTSPVQGNLPDSALPTTYKTLQKNMDTDRDMDIDANSRVTTKLFMHSIHCKLERE